MTTNIVERLTWALCAAANGGGPGKCDPHHCVCAGEAERLLIEFDRAGMTLALSRTPGGDGNVPWAPGFLRDPELVTAELDRLTAEVERLRTGLALEQERANQAEVSRRQIKRDLAAANAAREAAEARANDGDALIDGRLRDAEARLAVAEKALREAIASLRDNRIGAAMTIIDAALIAALRDNRTPEAKP